MIGAVSCYLKQRAKPVSKSERDIDFAQRFLESTIGYFRTVTVRDEIVMEPATTPMMKSIGVYKVVIS